MQGENLTCIGPKLELHVKFSIPETNCTFRDKNLKFRVLTLPTDFLESPNEFFEMLRFLKDIGLDSFGETVKTFVHCPIVQIRLSIAVSYSM